MPFGLTNTLIVFMDLMNKVFQDCLNKFLMMFIEDIFVCSKTQEKHIKFSKYEFLLD